jgi:vesicle-fusing ATPase
MTENRLIENDVDFSKLSKITKNYNGIEIEGVVKTETSYIFFRSVNMRNFDENLIINPYDKVTKGLLIVKKDFILAIKEIRP